MRPLSPTKREGQEATWEAGQRLPASPDGACRGQDGVTHGDVETELLTAGMA